MPLTSVDLVARAFRLVRGLLIALALLFLVVTFTPIVKLITLAMEPDWYGGNGQVLVVLSGSMLVPGTGPNAALGSDTYLRCVYASWVLRAQKFTYVLVSGGDGAAEGMAGFLQRNGVESRAILTENRARSTYQNALNSKDLLESVYGKGRLPPVVILTSDYHAWRARRVFAHAGFEARAIPVPDVLKKSASLLDRWPAFLTLLDEFTKDAFYFAHGRL